MKAKRQPAKAVLGTKKSALPVDALVGHNIRICRLQQGLSQTELGRQIGVTFQQVQKYENGTNRVGASRLSQIANVLEVPLSALFEGRAGIGKGLAEQSPHALLAKPHALRLLQAFHKIQREPLKVAILKLIESLAS